MYMTIDNNIPGMLYRTGDLTKPEKVRLELKNAANSDVSFSMSGPMVNYITFKNIKCSQVTERVGNLTLSPLGGGPDMVIDLAVFLTTSGSNCILAMSFIVTGDKDDQLYMGQQIFFGYNVVFNHG